MAQWRSTNVLSLSSSLLLLLLTGETYRLCDLCLEDISFIFLHEPERVWADMNHWLRLGHELRDLSRFIGGRCRFHRTYRRCQTVSHNRGFLVEVRWLQQCFVDSVYSTHHWWRHALLLYTRMATICCCSRIIQHTQHQPASQLALITNSSFTTLHHAPPVLKTSSISSSPVTDIQSKYYMLPHSFTSLGTISCPNISNYPFL